MNKNVTLHFSANNSFVSRAICWWTTAPVSHVAIEIEGYVYEALAKGFVKRDKLAWILENRTDPSKHVETYSFALPQPDATQEWLDSRVGDDYDYPGLASYLIPIFRELPASLYCSEAARLALIVGGLEVLKGENLHPGALRWVLMGVKRGR